MIKYLHLTNLITIVIPVYRIISIKIKIKIKININLLIVVMNRLLLKNVSRIKNKMISIKVNIEIICMDKKID
jgi:hypothetical protein